MSTWRGSLVFTGLVFAGILFTLGSANDAFAVDITLGAATCLTLPGGGTSWDGPTSTCTKTGGGHMTIAATDTLIIPNGVTLANTANRDIRIVGGLTNNGDIIITTNRDIRNDGVITNNGGITFTTGGDINNRNSGEFTNSGTITSTTSGGNLARITNQDTAIFTNTELGSITLDGTAGTNNNRARIQNQESASFENAGTISIEGVGNNSGRLLNRDDATFTNSGTVTIEGISESSGRLLNRDDATFTNSGTVTITGDIEDSGRLLNRDDATFTNSGTVTITGTSNNSGQLRNNNAAIINNSGTITLTGINNVSGKIVNLSTIINSGFLITNNGVDNNNVNSEINNSGILQITLNLNNNNGSIFNSCSGEISFGTFSGNPIEEESVCPISSGSGAYEDPTIGKSHDGRQVVENGICIDITCWTVTADYHQEFELVEMLTDSVHTISTTVFCQNGVNKCNYVAFGVSPYGTNINDSVWKIILQKDHRDNWTMKIIDPDGYLGEITSTTQIVNDNRYLAASATIEFKKPTPGMILNVEVRDSNGGYRDFKFNDGIEIVDAYAYPLIETSYEPPLEIKPLCLNENVNKRYTCAFEKVREWTIKNAESALDKLNK